MTHALLLTAADGGASWTKGAPGTPNDSGNRH